MLALIDGDILVYRIGFTTEDVTEKIAFWRMDELIDSILSETKADEFRIFITKEKDPTSFRKRVYPEYKMNRRHKPKPLHYRALRSYLEANWNAEVVSKIEADDALAIEQDPNSVICSIDKDLLQIEGNHYNFVKNDWCFIDEETGYRNFYTQLIVGDSSDNLKGIPGAGPVAAKKALSSCRLEEDFFSVVREMYDNDEAMLLTGRCAWIWRHHDDDWLNHYNTLIKEMNGDQAEIGRRE